MRRDETWKGDRDLAIDSFSSLIHCFDHRHVSEESMNQ